ncbi:MAG TPA: hypothetical protein VFJ16_09390 [Longimicrobium sp.]|nr:hypothetical protein [Longimicrobium sp.]
MSRDPEIVAIVVDPRYSSHLAALADQMPVWIADTPPNRAAAEAYRRVHRPVYPLGVTTFRVSPNDSPSSWAAGILPYVVEHHGPHGQAQPATTLEFIGTGPSEDLLGILAEFGFRLVQAGASSFRATAA